MLKGEFKQAEKQYREALDILRQTQNETHPHHIDLLLILAELYYLQGAYADAEKQATSALDLGRRGGSRNFDQHLMGLSLLSLIHAKTDRRARAAVFLREALTLFNNNPDEDKDRDAGVLGEALVEMKREAEARPLLLKRYTFYARALMTKKIRKPSSRVNSLSDLTGQLALVEAEQGYLNFSNPLTHEDYSRELVASVQKSNVRCHSIVQG